MAKPANETGLVKQIVKAVYTEYPSAFGWKVHGGPMQAAGIPDLVFCIAGLFIAMEVKFQHPGESIEHARNRASVIQRRQIRAINEAGGIAGVVLSSEEALDLIRRAFIKHHMVQTKEIAHGA